VESIHHIAACVMDAEGDVIFSLGDIDAPVYLRSTAKPFIAATAIAHAVHERFGLEPREIAIMAASHAGQPFHVEAVRSILAKIGMDESALQCGAHAPYNGEAARELERQHIAPSAVHNNCSGKHSGILALCKVLGADPSTYMQVENPAQQEILAFCSRMADIPVEDLPLGVDGCGIPVYAVPLRNAALSFMRFARLSGINQSDRQALETVRDAMVAYPEYISGTGEFDARLMQAAGGSVACKGGAEGVHGAAIIDKGVGMAVKVIDGASRGRGPAVLSIMRRNGLLSEGALTKLADLERPIVYNRAGRVVGEVRAAGTFAVSKASTR
jgi:L-asparaginase II